MAIISRTPVRISFGGGGTDLASYYEKYGGLVVSVAINKYFYTILELRDDDRIQLISSDARKRFIPLWMLKCFITAVGISNPS
ncbi:MAG: hypothetical protein KJ886_03370, partial [Candidatus Thermoplasmatota archaeon]|nr:hypothetical protein [Candidatus Thermoplasmatota archaeon]